jgi:CO/xanthine dehydrogenase Mo-binding subunit
MPDGFDVIGSRVARKDAPAKATGQAVFMEDMSFPANWPARFCRALTPMRAS